MSEQIYELTFTEKITTNYIPTTCKECPFGNEVDCCQRGVKNGGMTWRAQAMRGRMKDCPMTWKEV